MKAHFKNGIIHHVTTQRQFVKGKSKIVIWLFMIIFLSINFSNAQTSGNGVPPGMSKLDVRLLLNTSNGSSNTADGCTVLFKSNFLAGLGPEDSYKFTNVDENMALSVGNSLLSVEGKPHVVDYDTIPLKIWKYRQTNYYLRFDANNFSTTLAAVLKDNYLHQEHIISLTAQTLINFTLTTDTLSAAADRFCIYFKPASILPLSMLSFSASKKEKGVQIQWSMANETGIDQFEIEKSTDANLFTKIGAVMANSGSSSIRIHQWIDRYETTGNCYYRIKSVSKSGDAQYSKIIKIAGNTHTNGIGVYPNPVSGSTIGLQMFDMQKGNYQVKLYNANGQQVFSTVLPFAGGTATQQLNISKSLIKGTYTIRLTDGNSDFSKAILIN